MLIPLVGKPGAGTDVGSVPEFALIEMQGKIERAPGVPEAEELSKEIGMLVAKVGYNLESLCVSQVHAVHALQMVK